MKDKFVKILLINTIFFLSFIEISKSELIIPQKKPTLSSETIKKSKLNNFVLPLKKPLISLESEIIITNQENNIVNGIVIPKSKPLVVKKDKPIVKKNQNISVKRILITRNRQSNLWKRETGLRL